MNYSNIYSSNLLNEIKKYYITYYRDDCSLPDYLQRTENRINEESRESVRIERLQRVTGFNFRNKRHFVVGAGTGGLAVVLYKEYDGLVYGIEPNEAAISIIRKKCKTFGMNPNNFKREPCEQISFEDNSFDYVHCFTVLEHVRDVEKSIDEMIRITKPGGKIYINTPNYADPYEGHYKILFPTFLPKIFGKLYLISIGKSTELLNTINFITEKKMNRILSKKKNITWLRIYEPGKRTKGILGLFLDWITFSQFVYKNQEIVIVKMSK